MATGVARREMHDVAFIRRATIEIRCVSSSRWLELTIWGMEKMHRLMEAKRRMKKITMTMMTTINIILGILRFHWLSVSPSWLGKYQNQKQMKSWVCFDLFEISLVSFRWKHFSRSKKLLFCLFHNFLSFYRVSTIKYFFKVTLSDISLLLFL